MSEQPQQQLEQLADVQHEIWSHWMKYLFSVSTINEQGECVIPTEYVERWQKQAHTSYAELSEKERESDREQARKVIQRLEEQ